MYPDRQAMAQWCAPALRSEPANWIKLLSAAAALPQCELSSIARRITEAMSPEASRLLWHLRANVGRQAAVTDRPSEVHAISCAGRKPGHNRHRRRHGSQPA